MEFYRHRRRRRGSGLRQLVRETKLSVDDFIQPLFVKEGLTEKQEVASMPGVYQFSLEDLLPEVQECVDLGIRAVIVFGITSEKYEIGSQASADNVNVQEANSLI